MKWRRFQSPGQISFACFKMMETTQLLKVSNQFLCCCVPLCLPMLSIYARTHTHERTLANTYIATHPCSHARIRPRTLARSHARTPAPAHDRTHAFTLAHSQAPTHERTNARTHARKNTRTHARSFSRTHPRTMLALAPRGAHLCARTRARTRARTHGSTHVSTHPCWLAQFAVSLSPTFVFLSSLLMYNRCTVDELQLFCRGVNYLLLSHYSPDVSVIVWLAEPLQNHTIVYADTSQRLRMSRCLSTIHTTYVEE